MALAVQYALYARLLQGTLKSPASAQGRSAIVRWVKVMLAWQLLVLLAAGAYVVVMASNHARGAAWVAPSVGAVVGSALSLQLVVVSILRASRR